MNMPSFIIDLASSLIKIRDRRSEHVKRASDFESREYLGVMNEDPKLNWMTFLAFFFVCSLWVLMDVLVMTVHYGMHTVISSIYHPTIFA